MKRFSFPVLAAVIAGAICGFLFPGFSLQIAWIGELYLSLLKMILLPLIILAILHAFGRSEAKGIGRVGVGGALFYAVSSLSAAVVGILFYRFWMPREIAPQETAIQNASQGFDPIGLLVPGNLFDALADGRILPVIFFTVLFGIALLGIDSAHKNHLSRTLEALYAAMMRLTGGIILLTPIGAFSLMAVLITKLQAEALAQIGSFVLVVIGAGLFHSLVVLPLMALGVGRFNPWKHLVAVKEALIVAFVTGSSAATLPVSIRVSQLAGVRPGSAGLLLPLGATLNMDGSALYHALTALFLAHLSGVDLTLWQQVTLLGVVMLSSAGTAAIPGGGIAMMAFVLSVLGVEPVWLGLYLLVDRVLDNYITAINVWSDLVAVRAVDTRLAMREETHV